MHTITSMNINIFLYVMNPYIYLYMDMNTNTNMNKDLNEYINMNRFIANSDFDQIYRFKVSELWILRFDLFIASEFYNPEEYMSIHCLKSEDFSNKIYRRIDRWIFHESRLLF
jgi:hypothetical protein